MLLGDAVSSKVVVVPAPTSKEASELRLAAEKIDHLGPSYVILYH